MTREKLLALGRRARPMPADTRAAAVEAAVAASCRFDMSEETRDRFSLQAFRQHNRPAYDRIRARIIVELSAYLRALGRPDEAKKVERGT